MMVGRILLMMLCIALVAPVASIGDDDSKNEQPSGKKPKKKPKKSTRKKSGGGDVDMSSVPAAKKAEGKALEGLGSAFKVMHTRHYSVLYDTSKESVDEFGTAIERTYRSCMKYTDKLGIKVRKPKRKLMIYYFEAHETYNGHSVALGLGERPQSNPGVYFPHLNFSMFFNFRNQASYKAMRDKAEAEIEGIQEQLRRTKGAERRGLQEKIKRARRRANWSNTRGGDQSESIVQHEVAHQVLWNIGFHNSKTFMANPRWLAEGTAMLFEPIASGKSANIGKVNKERLESYQHMDRAGQLFPLVDMISTPALFHSRQQQSKAYSQSWAMVHYLNRVKKKELKKYIELLNQRSGNYTSTPEQELADFESIFGKPDRLWERKWKKWMKRVR